MGKALVATGMAEFIAVGLVRAAGDLPTPVILSAFILIMAVLTNLVSNNAAAVIGTPIAIAAAQQLGAEPLPFVLAVLFGANMSFATPFGYQTNLCGLSESRCPAYLDPVGRVLNRAAFMVWHLISSLSLYLHHPIASESLRIE
jgi:di/tricarboxylate transporter